METGSKISIIQNYNQRYTSFCNQYGKPNLRLSKKLIHQLRVDIKNMRAIFDLLKIINNENCIEEGSIVFDKLFQAAGRVREEQVNLTNVYRYKFSSSLTLYRNYLVKRKRSAFRVLHKTLNEFILANRKGCKKACICLNETDNQHEIADQTQSYIQKRIKIIKKLYPFLTAKNLHKIRKELKNINSIAFFLYEISPTKKLAKLHAKIKPVESQMGVWHNRVVLQNSIKQFLTLDDSFPEVLMLKQLLVNIKKQNKKTIRQIDKKMGKLFGN